MLFRSVASRRAEVLVRGFPLDGVGATAETPAVSVRRVGNPSYLPVHSASCSEHYNQVMHKHFQDRVPRLGGGSCADCYLGDMCTSSCSSPMHLPVVYRGSHCPVRQLVRQIKNDPNLWAVICMHWIGRSERFRFPPPCNVERGLIIR